MNNGSIINLEGDVASAGVQGYSAYEIAVQNGYTGTEEEWVNEFLSPEGYLPIRDVIDNLSSSDANKSLSANQGKILKTLIDGNSNAIVDETNQRQAVDSSLQSQIASLSNGSPLKADSIAEMTDTTRTYVNTTDGNWYYYDGEEWIIGGLYQASDLGTQQVNSDNIKYKDIKPNNIANFQGYDLSERLRTDGATYDKIGIVIGPSSEQYAFKYFSTGRSIKTMIPNNSYITINKELSDIFRVCLYRTEPKSSGHLPAKVICDDNTLTNISFNSENYNWLVVCYTVSNETPDIKVTVENTLDYNSLLRENNLDIFDKVDCDNIFDKDLILKGVWVGPLGENYQFKIDEERAHFRSFIFPMIKDETYTITKNLTDKFRVALFINHPKPFVEGHIDTYFDAFAQKIIFDDATQTNCEFNSENYRYCVVTYTIEGQDVDMTITNSSNTKYILKKPYVKDIIEDIVEGSFENYHIVEADGGCEVSNVANPNHELWSNWNSRLAFGMNTNTAPVPFRVKSQILIDGTCIVRNQGNQNYNRWGFHVFEAYDQTNFNRITMLVDKHIDEFDNTKTAELYYYTGANHHASSYGYFKLGSDVKYHSFLFNRDKMLAAGEIDCRFPVTLARISPANDLDSSYESVEEADTAYEPETNAPQNMKCLKYIALKNAVNGCMWYDKDRHKVVVKINGEWHDINTTPVPDGTYNF